MRNVETMTPRFSLKPFILYKITKTVRLNDIQFSQEGITRNATSIKPFPSLNFRYPFRFKGISEIQAKRFPQKDFHCVPLTIDKNHLIAEDFYRFRFLSIDSSVVFERVADLNREKLGAYKPGQYKPSEDFKPSFTVKNNILKIFCKSVICLILGLSIAT